MLSIPLNKTVTEIQYSTLYRISSQIWLWSHTDITALKNFITSYDNNFGHSLLPSVIFNTMTTITHTLIVN